MIERPSRLLRFTGERPNSVGRAAPHAGRLNGVLDACQPSLAFGLFASVSLFL